MKKDAVQPQVRGSTRLRKGVMLRILAPHPWCLFLFCTITQRCQHAYSALLFRLLIRLLIRLVRLLSISTLTQHCYFAY